MSRKRSKPYGGSVNLDQPLELSDAEVTIEADLAVAPEQPQEAPEQPAAPEPEPATEKPAEPEPVAAKPEPASLLTFSPDGKRYQDMTAPVGVRCEALTNVLWLGMTAAPGTVLTMPEADVIRCERKGLVKRL